MLNGRRGSKQNSSVRPNSSATNSFPSSTSPPHNPQISKSRRGEFLGSQTANPSPAPATSHPACVFSALAKQFFQLVVEQAQALNLMSDEHFTVDGTLLEACASLKSFSSQLNLMKNSADCSTQCTHDANPLLHVLLSSIKCAVERRGRHRAAATATGTKPPWRACRFRPDREWRRAGREQ